MFLKDDSASDHPLPLFLANEADEIERHGAFRTLSIRILKNGFLLLTALVVGSATLLLADPVPRLKAVTASLVGTPAEAPAVDQPTLSAPSSADAQASLPVENDVQSGQPAAAPDTTDQQQAGASEGGDALFKQFQAWAQQQDSKPEAQPAPAQDDPTQAAPSAPAQAVPPKPSVEAAPSAPARAAVNNPATARVVVPKPRPVREPRNARAEMEAARKAQAKAASAHAAPARPQPAEEAQVQDAPAPATQTPSLLQLFGLHN